MCRSIALIAVGVLYAASSARGETIDAYAPPNVWESEYKLPAHLGEVTYTVEYKPLGKTAVVGEVSYYAADGKLVRKQFNKRITFRTGNAVAAPSLRFKGVPFGSAVRVTY